MNDELRAALDLLDSAIETARAALEPPEPEPPSVDVPRPEEEKPKTVTVTKLDKRYCDCFSEVSSITAVWHNIEGPCLRIVGDGDTDTHTLTKMDLADIQRQAAEAGIELPEVTVDEGTSQWVKIERVDCRIHDGKPLTMVQGFAVGEELARSRYGTDITPAQVVRLCELAGWPKPEVDMVLTFANGDPCQVDPADIQNAEYDAAFHATRVQMRNEYMYLAHYVREPVDVVQRMIDACKEGE